jgi:molybdate transport repressor ModE-like protein
MKYAADMRPVLSVRLYTKEKCFGPGIAELLLRVRRLHSLRAAAASMDMAYSKAWRIVKETEQALGFELLVSTTGGKHGGGAELTGEAERLLDDYAGFVQDLREAAQALFDKRFSRE